MEKRRLVQEAKRRAKEKADQVSDEVGAIATERFMWLTMSSSRKEGYSPFLVELRLCRAGALSMEWGSRIGGTAWFRAVRTGTVHL